MCAYHWQLLLKFVTGSCVVLMLVLHCETEGADWKERLLSEAPSKWTSLEKYYANMEASFRDMSQYTSNKNSSSSVRPAEVTGFFDIRKNGELMVSTLRSVNKWTNGKQTEEVVVNGVNSRYAFRLVKSSPNADSFILADFQRASDELRQKVHGFGEHNFGMVFEVGYDSVPMSKLIKDPLVTIKDVHGAKSAEREVVQMSYDREIFVNGERVIEHGMVILDPDHFWCVREAHSDIPDFKIDGTREYGDDVDGFPILRREQHTLTYKDGTMTEVATCEFDRLVHRDIPESEFTLSAFGLPEMQVPGEKNPVILWRWLLGIGVALGVIAVLIRRYAKRRQMQQHA